MKLGLLWLDALIDSTAWRFSRWLGGVWGGGSDFMGRFRMRGWRRAVFEVLSEGANLGTAGFVVLLAFAVPSFRATESDWRAQGEYAATFLDRNGQIIGRRGVFLDDTVPLDDLPPYLIQAALATEDRRFFDHFGIDIIGTLRAIVTNARAGGVVQGGSSLSQQLAKNMFLSNERTLQRKVKEAYLALWLEANFSKREILKMYLDHAYMGGGTHGVAAASQFYFGKSVRDINLAEAAMLAGLFKAPTKYAPHTNLAAARARANQVLSNLVDAGFMTEGQVAEARRNPATPVDMVKNAAPDWYLDWAFEEVKRIAPGGDRTIVVKTTLDPRLQASSEAAIETSLRLHGADYRVTQGAVVLQDLDGAVRAMVGGKDYGESNFNRAVAALRQPGSSFKPFVYATAFMNGYSVDSIVPDAPITIGNWSPRNYGRGYAGNVTLKSALARSINTIPVRLAQAIGRDKIVETAHRLGIRTELKITNSLPLGVAEVTVLDMAGAYAAFANGGMKATPYSVDEIKLPDGKLVYQHARDEQPAERVLPPGIAAEMNEAMVAVVEAGTGGKAKIPGWTVGGKTGTTQSYRDAWFVGFTGQYSAAVWFGNDDYTPTNNMTGGSLPAMTFSSLMTAAHEGLTPKPLPGVGMEEPLVVEAAPQPTTPSINSIGNRPVLTLAALNVLDDVGQSMRSRLEVLETDESRPTILRPGAAEIRRPTAVMELTNQPLSGEININGPQIIHLDSGGGATSSATVDGVGLGN